MKTVNRHHSFAPGGRVPLMVVLLLCLGSPVHAQSVEPDLVNDRSDSPARIEKAMPIEAHRETPRDPWMPRASTSLGTETGHSGAWSRGSFESVQVNVDANGNNIFGDAANEPSIAVDPTDPNRIVIGWRQFDNVSSNFRQAGWAYSHDGGATWTFPGVLEPGVFRSDPVLGADADGNIYFYSLSAGFTCELFTSNDAGVTWNDKVFAFGGDKAWMTIDRTGGVGHGNLYFAWSGDDQFTRSTDGGSTFLEPIPTPFGGGFWGTLAVDPSGFLYLVGAGFRVIRSTNARFPNANPTFGILGENLLGGTLRFMAGPNPGGLLGQAWIAVDHSFTSTRGNIYVLGSVGPWSQVQVMFARSVDGGTTWSEPIRINDDSLDLAAWHWFGTMSVAPNGRIDVIWNDTRNTGETRLSELFYSFSLDGGITWSKNIAVSPVFDSWVGWPRQNKIGDYYDMVSDFGGVNIAYAATFNKEQDVYFLRIEVEDCNENGVFDSDDILSGFSDDCDANGVPDDCQNDCNDTGVADRCDILNGTSRDCNENFVPDECDPDFDRDGTTDMCDPDIDNDGIPNELDVCLFAPLVGPSDDDGRPFSDTNRNCAVDLTDYARFRNCLGEGGPGVNAPPATCLSAFDYNDDGHVDLRDAAGFSVAFTGDP